MSQSNKNQIPHQQQHNLLLLEDKKIQESDQNEINQLNDAYSSMLKDKRESASQKQQVQSIKNNQQIKPQYQQNVLLSQIEPTQQQNQQFQQYSIQQPPQYLPFQYANNPYQCPSGRGRRGGHHGRGWGHHSHWQQPPPPSPPYAHGFEQQGQYGQLRTPFGGCGGFGGGFGGGSGGGFGNGYGGGFGNYQAPQPKFQQNKEIPYSSNGHVGWGGDHRERKGWKGKCRGWEKGQKHEGRRHKHRSRSHSSRSSSSSQDGAQFKSNSKPNQQLNQIQQQYLQLQANVQAHYLKQMTGFFQSRMINELQRQKIIDRLIYKFPQGNLNSQQLIQCLEQAEAMNLVFKMPYFRIVKQILKFNFDMYEAAPRLWAIQQKKIKKFEADNQFKQKYGDKEVPNMFDVDELVNLDVTKTLFLVDGNNIFPTNKHFRRYFQSYLVSQKIQAQLRLQWLLSHALEPQGAILFFDQKYDADTFQMTKHYILPDEDLNRLKNIEVVHGVTTTADNRIITRLEQLKEQNIGKKIVLVSADRDLYMRCLGVTQVDHTSGKYFFKFCKYRMFKLYKGIKEKKCLAKTIMKYHNH